MISEAQPGDSQENDPDDGPLRRSFHTRLLFGSETTLSDYRKTRSLPLNVNRWSWLGQVIGQAATFVGGVAVGVAIMLIRRGEDSRDRPALMIGAGVVCVLFAIGFQLVIREYSKRPTSPVRG